MQKGVCLLCGSYQHWVRECHRYAETMGANPRSSALVTAVWCLRCGTDDHCRAKCVVDGAPIHEPAGGQAQYGVCLWCGIRGHNYRDCLRRVPETLAQEQQKSSALRDEFDTHKASAAGHAQDIATLKSQVASLQSAVAPLPEMKRDLESLTSRVQGLMQWRSAQEKASADMKKSFEDHLVAYDEHVRASKALEKKQDSLNKSFEDFLQETWPMHASKFEDLLKRQSSAPIEGGSPGSPVVVSQDPDTTMVQAPVSGKRSATGRDPPETPNKRSSSSSAKWWLSLKPWSSQKSPPYGIRTLLRQWSQNGATASGRECWIGWENGQAVK